MLCHHRPSKRCRRRCRNSSMLAPTIGARLLSAGETALWGVAACALLLLRVTALLCAAAKRGVLLLRAAACMKRRLLAASRSHAGWMHATCSSPATMPHRWPKKLARGLMRLAITSSAHAMNLVGRVKPHTWLLPGEPQLSTALSANSTPDKPTAQVCEYRGLQPAAASSKTKQQINTTGAVKRGKGSDWLHASA